MQDVGFINNMEHLPIRSFNYGSSMNDYQQANITIKPLKCRGTKELDKSDISCTTLKRAGHFKSGIYTLKGPNDYLPRMSFCNMDSENGDLETLVGYIKVQSSQLSFRAYTSYSSTSRLRSTLIFSFRTPLELNDGDAYNNENGLFVTPVSGNYTFNLQLVKTNKIEESERSRNCSLEVHVDGSPVKSFEIGGKYYNSYYYLMDFNETWELTLEKGSRVHINAPDNCSGSGYIGIGYRGIDKLTWSGSLVAAFEI